MANGNHGDMRIARPSDPGGAIVDSSPEPEEPVPAGVQLSWLGGGS
jgi:hypothetical protein